MPLQRVSASSAITSLSTLWVDPLPGFDAKPDEPAFDHP
jgi:hypothetical protein